MTAGKPSLLGHTLTPKMACLTMGTAPTQNINKRLKLEWWQWTAVQYAREDSRQRTYKHTTQKDRTCVGSGKRLKAFPEN